ncbi:MAG: xanthine dehydrogenase small subunit [Bacteroidales bacterium]
MKSEINFLLNGEAVTLDFAQERDLYPHMTVMRYLREFRRLTGTKEGCGIGDCGACTVAIAGRGAKGEVLLNSANSCLMMLGMLDGKHLITVEGIKEGEKLHPVQSSLLKRRGAQCGFCTPGIVVSSFVHYENGKEFTSESVREALSGNLCRCTGYESIREALVDIGNRTGDGILQAITLPDVSNEDFYWEDDRSVYIKPADLKSLLGFKDRFPEYLLVCGASDISVKNKIEEPEFNKLIDISDIAELKFTEYSDGFLTIGAAASIETLRRSLKELYPQTNDYLQCFASLPIRNSASAGGNVAGASAVGDIMPMLLALKAKMRLLSVKGERFVKCSEFNTGYRKQILKPNEIIHSFIIPAPSANQRIYLHKQSRRKDMDISAMSFCISFEVDNNRIKNCSTGFGGMAPRPVSSPELEQFLNGKLFDESTFNAAAELVPTLFSTISDMRGSAEYRKIVASNLLIKCYRETK